MSNLRIVPKNMFDHPACVLTCTATPVATLPLNNLKNFVRNRIARIPANPAFQIKGTFGGNGVYVDMASLCRVNLEPAATWRFRGYSDAAWTTQVVDTGTLTAIDSATLGTLGWGVQPLGSGIFDPFYGQKMTVAWFARNLILSFIIDIDDHTNSTGFVDISRGWGGDYFELAYNPVALKNSWKENSVIWETDGGAPRIDASNAFRRMPFDLTGIPDADRTMWFDILRYCGMHRDVFVSVYPGGSGPQIRDYMMDAIFESLPDLSTLTTLDSRFSTTITLREV